MTIIKASTHIGSVSPQDGTPAKTDLSKFFDRHGNEATFDEIAEHRPWRKVKDWIRDNFGVGD